MDIKKISCTTKIERYKIKAISEPNDYLQVRFFEMMKKFKEAVFDLFGTEIPSNHFLCISAPEVIRDDHNPDYIIFRVESKYGVAQSKEIDILSPVIKYKNVEIKHPSKLTFWQRVKFIFTGNYPE